MDLRDLIIDQTEVSLSLAKHIIATVAKDVNLVFSPLSMHVILGLIAAGSEGETRDQLLFFLNSKSTETLHSLSSQLVDLLFVDGGPLGGPRLSFANSVWIDRSFSFKPSFKNIVDNVYKAASSDVDFQTKAVEVTEEVNAWADQKTNGLIKEILPSGAVDSSTRLVFANAVYFKGEWNEKFDASQTKDHEFFLLNGNSVLAPFLTSKKKQYVSEFDGFKVLGLSYKQGEDRRKFSMYFFLPDANDGLAALSEKIAAGSGFFDRHLPYERVEVGNFLIPKFKINFGFEASETFKELGLVLPFTGNGLTEIVDSPLSKNLHVSSIYHKAFIEMNEEGTEAAASTVAVVTLRAVMVHKKIDFVADHPFLFALREDMTGVVLFIGHVINPLIS